MNAEVFKHLPCCNNQDLKIIKKINDYYEKEQFLCKCMNCKKLWFYIWEEWERVGEDEASDESSVRYFIELDNKEAKNVLSEKLVMYENGYPKIDKEKYVRTDIVRSVTRVFSIYTKNPATKGNINPITKDGTHSKVASESTWWNKWIDELFHS